MIILKNDTLLVREIDEKDIKEGGLYLPKNTTEEEQVADGVVEETCNEKEYPKGSRVFYHKIAPVDVRLGQHSDTKKYWFVSVKDILCVIE